MGGKNVFVLSLFKGRKRTVVRESELSQINHDLGCVRQFMRTGLITTHTRGETVWKMMNGCVKMKYVIS